MGRPDERGVRFTYYGAMTMLVERSDGYKILFDPYLINNPLTTAVPADFADVDLVVITHAAFDHMEDAPEILRLSHAQVLCGFDVKHMLLNAGIEPERIIGTGYGASHMVGETTEIRSIVAQHSSIAEMGDNGLTCWPPYGFIAHIQPGVTYFHTGDTYIYSDMRMIRELYHPDVMVAGISGITEKHTRQMTAREAAMMVSWVGPHVAVPAHYPPNCPDLPLFRRHMESFAPDVAVLSEPEVPFVCYPFLVNVEK